MSALKVNLNSISLSLKLIVIINFRFYYLSKEKPDYQMAIWKNDFFMT